MYLLVSNAEILEKDIWAGKAKCSCRKKNCHFYLAKLKSKWNAYGFIPVFSFTKKRYLVCDNCHKTTELKKKEFRKTHERQMDMLVNGQMPSEIVLNDCSPQNLNMVKRWIKLIISSLFALLMVCCSTVLVGNFFSVIVSWLCFLPIGFFPFYFVLTDFIEAIKKRRAYKKALNNPSCFSTDMSDDDNVPSDLVSAGPYPKRKIRCNQAIGIVLLLLLFLLPLTSFMLQSFQKKYLLQTSIRVTTKDVQLYTPSGLSSHGFEITIKNISDKTIEKLVFEWLDSEGEDENNTHYLFTDSSFVLENTGLPKTISPGETRTYTIKSVDESDILKELTIYFTDGTRLEFYEFDLRFLEQV